MVKITIEIANPISAIGKKIASRKIEKINEKIEKLNNQKSKLESKFFNDSKVDSDKATESTKTKQEVKQEVQPSVTLFISPEMEKKHGDDVISLYAKNGVKAEIVDSKGKDKFVKPAEKANSDKFNEVTKKLESQLRFKGVRKVNFPRKYNKGGIHA